jgi:hypothetical protein
MPFACSAGIFAFSDEYACGRGGPKSWFAVNA